jgi:hypothetical protein
MIQNRFDFSPAQKIKVILLQNYKLQLQKLQNRFDFPPAQKNKNIFLLFFQFWPSFGRLRQLSQHMTPQMESDRQTHRQTKRRQGVLPGQKPEERVSLLFAAARRKDKQTDLRPSWRESASVCFLILLKACGHLLFRGAALPTTKRRDSLRKDNK